MSINHIGIIMDGNRRFAKRLMLQPWKGYEWGAKKIEELLDWCMEEDIRYITLYSLSIENMDRPKEEFNFLMDLFEKEFLKMAEDHRIHENKIRITVVGRLDILPEKVQKAINKTVDATKDYDNYHLNLAIAYGGRQEILDAVRSIANDVKKGTLDPENIDSKEFSERLYSSNMPDPDLIIRTSGEMRTSGFLLWQAAHAEYYFSDNLWPDFGKGDFKKALDDYSRRDRRFGK